jgi:hypothetical protein
MDKRLGLWVQGHYQSLVTNVEHHAASRRLPSTPSTDKTQASSYNAKVLSS